MAWTPGGPRYAPRWADTARFFTDAHLRPDLALGNAQRYLSIPMHGCTQAEGCFNAIEPAGGLDTDGSYPDVGFDTSFLMAVELGPAGTARPYPAGLLAVGQPAVPVPHQTRRYAAGQWITERYTEAQITAHPALTSSTCTRRTNRT